MCASNYFYTTTSPSNPQTKPLLAPVGPIYP
jgi:hypothetical protein